MLFCDSQYEEKSVDSYKAIVKIRENCRLNYWHGWLCWVLIYLATWCLLNTNFIVLHGCYERGLSGIFQAPATVRGFFEKKKVFWFGTGHRGVLGTNDRSLEFSIWPQQPAETNRGIHHWEQEPLPLRLRRLITLIFYMHMKFSAKAFPKHKVWFKKFTKAFMCLKIWSNPLHSFFFISTWPFWQKPSLSTYCAYFFDKSLHVLCA